MGNFHSLKVQTYILTKVDLTFKFKFWSHCIKKQYSATLGLLENICLKSGLKGTPLVSVMLKLLPHSSSI